MHRPEDSLLEQALATFKRSATKLDWGALRDIAEPVTDDATFATTVSALSQIEIDSILMRHRLAIARADRYEALRSFISSWLAEEAEHSVVLRHISSLTGEPQIPYKMRIARPLAVTAVRKPSLLLGRLTQATPAAYCTVGAMQEFIAVTTYSHLARLAPDTRISHVLNEIAKQEARHMRFYRSAAIALLGTSPKIQRFTRWLITNFWHPPGMDLLGRATYEQSFECLLRNPLYTDRLQKVDSLTSSLPGLSDIHVMKSYLTSRGYLLTGID